MDTTYVVAKPFKTPTRRFAVGAEISAAELDGPMTAEDWVARGFLESAAAPALEKPLALSAPVFDPRAPLN